MFVRFQGITYRTRFFFSVNNRTRALKFSIIFVSVFIVVSRYTKLKSSNFTSIIDRNRKCNLHPSDHEEGTQTSELTQCTPRHPLTSCPTSLIVRSTTSRRMFGGQCLPCRQLNRDNTSESTFPPSLTPNLSTGNVSGTLRQFNTVDQFRRLDHRNISIITECYGAYLFP